MRNTMYLLLAIFMAAAFAACGSSGDGIEDTPTDPTTPSNPAFAAVPDNLGMPANPQSQIDQDLLESLSDALVVMSMEMAYAPESKKAKEFSETYIDVLQQIGYIQKFYPNAISTRGIWSIGKSSIDFYKACKNTETVYRTALIGAMTANSYSKSKMTGLYNELMKNKSSIFKSCYGLKDWTKDPEFFESYLDTPGKFWYHFSKGDLDSFAPNIYKTICNPTTLGDSFVKTDVLHELALDIVNERLDPNRLMLSAASPLIEQGFNIVFATDDIAGSAKLGYDLLNDNTKLIIDFKNGTLNVETFMTAANTNLKAMATAIKSILDIAGKPLDDYTGVKDTDDLFGLILDFVKDPDEAKRTAKFLSKEISDVLNEMGTATLKQNSLTFKLFENRVKDILNIHDGLTDEARFLIGTWQPDAFVQSGNAAKKKVIIDQTTVTLQTSSTKRSYPIHRVSELKQSTIDDATVYDAELRLYNGSYYDGMLIRLEQHNNFSVLTYSLNEGTQSDKYYLKGQTWVHKKGNQLVDMLSKHSWEQKISPSQEHLRGKDAFSYSFYDYDGYDVLYRIQYIDYKSKILKGQLKYVDNKKNELVYEITDKKDYPNLNDNKLTLTISINGSDIKIKDSTTGYERTYNKLGD